MLFLHEWNEAVQIPEWKYLTAFSLYPHTASSFLKVYRQNAVRLTIHNPRICSNPK